MDNIGVPLQFKALYYLNKKVSIGLNSQVILSEYSTTSIGVCFNSNM